MTRVLRYSSANYNALNRNGQHNFAQIHALNIYNSNAVYSFIPKNACSSMRTTLAIANGCIKDVSDFNWIHTNNHTFSCSLRELATAQYTFTVLRCPYSRLASAYLDKFVDRDTVAWQYVDLHERKINVEDITFDFFVRSMKSPNILNSDIHWKPQVNFLVYETYDDYFCLEDFKLAISTLKEKLDLSVVDARSLTQHGVGNYKPAKGRDFNLMTPNQLFQKKQKGSLPTYENLYTDELVSIVKKVYKADLALYKKKFGKASLLF
jgi:hypothetical protein